MIGIIAAMQAEMDAIVSILDTKEELSISGISMVKGTLSKKKVMVMKSGVGKGNAAMATTILLENYHVQAIVNIGTAGGLKVEQNILDAVVSDRVVQHDFDTSALDGEEGVGLYFDADKDFAELCLQTLQKMDIATHYGLIASGDQFIAKDEQLNRLAEIFPNAICAEMEAGAIAQICSHYQVPFVVLRSLSDIAHKEDSHMDFTTYMKHASKRSADFCKALLEKMA